MVSRESRDKEVSREKMVHRSTFSQEAGKGIANLKRAEGIQKRRGFARTVRAGPERMRGKRKAAREFRSAAEFWETSGVVAFPGGDSLAGFLRRRLALFELLVDDVRYARELGAAD